MKYQFEECLERGKIVRISSDPELIMKELHEAGADLLAAEHSLAGKNDKWAIIQGYYSMFHSLRSLVFARGYREKSQGCLKCAVETLLIDPGQLEPEVLEQFTFAMNVMEGADYGNVYDSATAQKVVTSARSIYERVIR